MEYLKERFEFVWKMRGKNSAQSSSWECRKPLQTNKTMTQPKKGGHLRQADVPCQVKPFLRVKHTAGIRKCRVINYNGSGLATAGFLVLVEGLDVLILRTVSVTRLWFVRGKEASMRQLFLWEEKLWLLDASRCRRKEYSAALSEDDGIYLVP